MSGEIELRWFHDQFERVEDISPDAVLVYQAHSVYNRPTPTTPLLLQYRSDGSDWKTVKYVRDEERML